MNFLAQVLNELNLVNCNKKKSFATPKKEVIITQNFQKITHPKHSFRFLGVIFGKFWVINSYFLNQFSFDTTKNLNRVIKTFFWMKKPFIGCYILKHENLN